MNKILNRILFLSKNENLKTTASRQSFDSENKNDSDQKIIIEHSYGIQFDITFPCKGKDQLTCGWLLQQVIKQLKNIAAMHAFTRNPNDIIALRTKNCEYAVDHLLADPSRTLDFLKENTILHPYYGPNDQESKEYGIKVSLDNFEVETKLGHGAFSQVYLVRKKDSGKLYALKQIRKGDLNRRKRTMIARERSSMLEVNSPFVIKLHWSFQSKDYCYFVLNFLPCGDLHHVLARKKRLSEKETKFFISESILGINAIHANNFIYRDLKPENLLLDLEGHLCITDFGLVKRVDTIHDANYSQCGTLGIMAPEILKEEGYNCLADYYNIGTLAYELATGKIPSLNSETHIFEGNINMENLSLSRDFKDFVARLLNIDPKTRLGAQKGLNEICDHPWLKDLKMIDVSKKKNASPIKIDPYSVQFSTKSINYDIDDSLNFYNLANFGMTAENESDNYVPHFSFYGFGSDSENFLSCYYNATSNQKAAITENSSGTYSQCVDLVPEASTETLKVKLSDAHRESKKAQTETNSDTIDEDGDIDEGEDRLAKKIALYGGSNDKRTKHLIQNIAKWKTTIKYNSEIIRNNL